MRTYSTLALLVLGLVLAPLLSPRPAVAASATVTYSFVPFLGTYADSWNGVAASVGGGSVTVNLFGPTVNPGVSATWTSAVISGLTWTTLARSIIGFPFPTPPIPAYGTGTVGGYGKFSASLPPGSVPLSDPLGAGARSIFLNFAVAGGIFTSFGAGVGSLFASGTDFGYPGWALTSSPGGLVEVASSVSIAPIPEPGSASLLGLGLLGLGGVAARLRARRGSRTS